MPYRRGVAIVALVGLMALAACSGPSFTSASSTTPRTAAPRTAWGDPDLQGVWRYEGAIPLERPAQLAGRASLTEKEVAEQQQLEQEQAAKRLAGQEGAAVGRRSVAESPIRGNEYNSFWQDHGRPRQVSTRTSLIVDPPDGRLPFTADASKAEARVNGWAIGAGIVGAGIIAGSIAAANAQPVYVVPASRCRFVDRFDRFGNYAGTVKVCRNYY